MRLLRKSTWFGAVLLISASAPAQAQISWQPNFNLAPTMMQAVVLNPCSDGSCENESKSRPPRKSAQPSPPAANPALLVFTPNLATRKRNIAGFVAKTRAQSPEGADQMAQMFASTDVFAAMAQGLAPTGLRIDNVADAYAAYWISAWEAAHGITGSTTSRAQAQGVKAQASRALLATPEFTKASAAQKQEFAEALLIQTALISASAEAAANDPAQMEAVGVAVRTGAKAMGLDLDAMTLGNTGFVPLR